MSDDANWVTIPSFHDQDVKKKGNIINAHHGSKSAYKYGNGNGNGNENRGKNRKSNNSRNGEKFPRDHRLRNNNRTSGFLASRSQPHTTNGIHSPHHNHSQLQNPVTKGSHNMPHQPPRSSLQKQAASFTPWSNRSSLMNANLSANANANANANHVNARIPNRVDANSIPRARARVNANTNTVAMADNRQPAAIPIAMYTNYRPQSQTISQTNYPPLQSQTYTERAPAQSDYAYRSNGSGTGKISAPQSYNNPHNSILNEGVGFNSSIVKNGSDFPNFPPLSNSVALSQSSMTPETNYNHLGNHGGINPITRSPPLAQSVSEPYRKHGGWAQIPSPQNYQILHHPEQRNQNTNHKKKKVMAGAGAGTGAVHMNNANKSSSHTNITYPQSEKRSQRKTPSSKKRIKTKSKSDKGAFPHNTKPKGKGISLSSNAISFLPSNVDHQAAAFTFLHANNTLPMGTSVKGKQKIGKRKKILTPLKKQILKERLANWREGQKMNQSLVGITVDDGTATNNCTVSKKQIEGLNSSKGKHTAIVFLKDYVSFDEIEDEEEYLEIQRDLQTLAEKVGPVLSVFIPRSMEDEVVSSDQAQGNESDDAPVIAYVQFEKVQDALAAHACWNGMILGGDEISAGMIPQDLIEEFGGGANDVGTTDSSVEVLKLIPLNKLLTILRQPETEYQHITGKENINENGIATVILTDALTEDDLEDEDCMEETLRDIRDLVIQYGPLIDGNNSVTVARERREVSICFKFMKDAKNGVAKLNGYVLGGSTISAKLDQEQSHSVEFTMFLENILSQDDYEDEECLEATREDVEVLASKYGAIKDVVIDLDGDTKGRVNIIYSNLAAAKSAVIGFNGMVIGGLTVKSWIVDASSDYREEVVPTLLLKNMLSEDDFEDEECLEETKSDVLELLKTYGQIEKFDIALDGVRKGDISIIFEDRSVAIKASKEIHGTMFGGSGISATVLTSDTSSNNTQPSNITPLNCLGSSDQNAHSKATAHEPMYSGDKVIPEQYAECKRVPKIPNTGIPREYAKQINDETVVPLLFEMLGELMRLQIRAKENKNAKARRRLVMGLREVARGIRARKVKMVVMANNLDQYGALDAKLKEILDLATEHELPVIFELNKRKIGKALGKTIKVSVVGIENADGAYEPFKKLKRLYG